VSSAEVVPEIDSRVGSKSAAARITAVSAVKYAVTERANQPVDALLAPRMEHFLRLLSDPDVNVRRAALLTLNYVSHHKPELVRDILPRFMPAVLTETKIRPDLIREVDLGPFKHKVDDGVDCRKAAYETLYTLLDTALDRVDIPALLSHVPGGMNDHYDIKLLTHMMLARLAAVAGLPVLENLDSLLVDPIRETVMAKAKDSAVKQEVERNDELVRSALRAVAAISKIPNVETAAPKFRDFMRQVVLTPEYTDKFKEISKEDVSDTFAPLTTEKMDISS
jgi:cullin-associated NEDD8-dissociated protein 1